MNKPKITIYGLFSVFIIYMLYILVSSLRPPEHIHSRDDVPQQASPLQAQKAADDLQLHLEKEPGNIALWLKLGHIYLEQQSFKKAVTVFRKAVVVDPKNAEALVDLGIALNAINKTEDAYNSFKQATEKFPGYAEGWLRLGLIYRFQLNDNTKALDNLEKYLSIEPANDLAPKVRNEIQKIKSEL